METTHSHCSDNHDYDTCECDCQTCDEANSREWHDRMHYSIFATMATAAELDR